MFRHVQLRQHLSTLGFTAYPFEMLANIPWSLNPLAFEERYHAAGFVDVAAVKDGRYYGFEYKSIRDQVSRAVKQCEAYILSFDFVVVVCERNLTSRSKYWRKLEKMGVGIWHITFNRTEVRGILQPEVKVEVEEKLAPKLQNPHPLRRKWVDERFHRYVWHDFTRRGYVAPKGQKQIGDFISQK